MVSADRHRILVDKAAPSGPELSPRRGDGGWHDRLAADSARLRLGSSRSDAGRPAAALPRTATTEVLGRQPMPLRDPS